MAKATVLPSLNFLSSRRDRLSSLRSQDQKFLYGALAFLGVIVLVTVGLVFTLLFFQNSLKQVSASESQTQRSLKTLADKEANFLIFSSRLDILAALWPQRGSQQQTLSFLTSIALPGVAFQQVQYEHETKILKFQAITNDYFRLEKFIELIRSDAVRSKISSFSVSTLRRNNTGEYSFEVELQLGEPSEQ